MDRLVRLNDAPGPTDVSFWTAAFAGGQAVSCDAGELPDAESRAAPASARARAGVRFDPSRQGEGTRTARDEVPGAMPANGPASGESLHGGGIMGEAAGNVEVRDDAVSVFEEFDEASPSFSPHSRGMAPGAIHAEPGTTAAPIAEEASGYRHADANTVADAGADRRFGASGPESGAETVREVQSGDDSESRSATDDRRGFDSALDWPEEFDDLEDADAFHEEHEFPPTPPADDMGSGISASAAEGSEMRVPDEASGHDGEATQADVESGEPARDANESASDSHAGDAARRPEGTRRSRDEYPAGDQVQDGLRVGDAGVEASGATSAVDEFDAIFGGDGRAGQFGSDAASGGRASGSLQDFNKRGAQPGHASRTREGANVSPRNLTSGGERVSAERGIPLTTGMAAAVLAGALGFAIAKFPIRFEIGPLATPRVAETAAYREPPAAAHAAGATGTASAAEFPKAGSIRPNRVSLSVLPDVLEPNGAGGDVTQSSGNDSSDLSNMSEPSGMQENPVQSGMAGTPGLAGDSAMPGLAGGSEPSGLSAANMRSTGDADMAWNGDQGNAAAQFESDSSLRDSSAIPSRAEPTDAPDLAAPSPASTSGLDSPSADDQLDPLAADNGAPDGNVPEDAPSRNIAEPAATLRNPRMDDRAGDLERIRRLEAQAEDRASLLADRVEANERSLREFASFLAEFPELLESFEETQVVLLDVADRVASIETAHDADLDKAFETLAEIEGNFKGLTAHVAILSRMAVYAAGAAGTEGIPEDRDAFPDMPQGLPMSDAAAIYFDADEIFEGVETDGSVPADVSVGDFVDGYGYVVATHSGRGGRKLVIMERGTVLVSE